MENFSKENFIELISGLGEFVKLSSILNIIDLYVPNLSFALCDSSQELVALDLIILSTLN